MSSLLNYFEPPDTYQGYFGLVCGYDADRTCAQLMVSRFLNLSDGEWTPRGYTPLAFMLNAHSQLQTENGWLRLYPRNDVDIPYRILHAKVALLLFTDDDMNWVLRLLVSTGNWTQNTLQTSLDLMWSLDVDSNDLVAEDCADIKSAWDMLKWLTSLHTLMLLQPIDNAKTVNSEHFNFFKTCVEEACGQANGMSRFFDNRKDSLLAQLPRKWNAVPKQNNHTPNFLAMGSGFFEPNQPTLLRQIVQALIQCAAIAKDSQIEVYVNPLACQGIASPQAKAMFEDNNWRIRNPEYQGEPGRTLHAKFLFAGYDNNRYPYICRNPCIYLGSGNLTNAGFSRPMNNGNLEAGVCFRPPEYKQNLRWYEDDTDHPAIGNFLPIGWENVDPPALLNPGENELAEQQALPIPPVTALLWNSGKLTPLEADADNFSVLTPERIPCELKGTTFLWPYERPARVTIRWEENEADVPIVDRSGFIGQTERHIRCINDFLDWLENYPACMEEELEELSNEKQKTDEKKTNKGDIKEQNEEKKGKKNKQESPTDTQIGRRYLIRTIMLLVESIAKKQTGLYESQWTEWCLYLSQKLQELSECEEIRELGQKYLYNPLTALLDKSFRPSFAEDATTEQGRLYEMALAKTGFFV